MRWPGKIQHWREAGLSSLLCLSVLAIAQTSPSPAKAADAAAAPAAKSHPASGQTSTHHTSSHTSTQKSKNAHGKKVAKKHGQQGIDPARAREIQAALIREHYMEGSPSGSWDSATQSAMQRYQADQGWQSKTTPDSRALIKLGLGPSHDHLLNPENAMTTPAPVTPPAADSKAAAKQ
jgi:hypothetical protein